MLVELVVDVGSTSTKLGYRLFGSTSKFEVRRFAYNELNAGDPAIQSAFVDPSTLPIKIVAFAREHLQVPPESTVCKIGWSQSGRIDPEDGSVQTSHILNTLGDGQSYDNFPLSAVLQKLLPGGSPNCKAANDGVAAGVGIVALAHAGRVELPCLSLCLGTGPAITVIDMHPGIQIYTTEGKWSCTVGTGGGEKPLFEAIGSRAVQGMAPDRFSERVKRAIPGLLQRYLTQFGWQPKTIVLSGGLANLLNAAIVGTDLQKAEGAPAASPLPRMVVLQGDDQEQLQIQGAALYSEYQGIISVQAVSKVQ